jgi:hypothetical protein
MLHLLTLSYPENPTNIDIENHRNFLLSLSNVLPCKDCRTHFKEHLQKCTLSNALKSRDDYVKCVWKMHNEVDSSKQISFEEFIQIYKEILDSDGYNPIKIHKSLKIYKYTTYGLIILLFLLYFIKNKK